MAKKITFGKLIKFKDKQDPSVNRLSLALGSTKNKDPKYDLNVEITIRDASGKVVASQTNGFIDLVDPRTEADRLLSLSIISEETAAKMKERTARLPESIRYEARIAKN